MCGIAGYLGKNSDFAQRFITQANVRLAHRGPDDEGVYLGPGIALGHRRLAILDLTAAGHQPLVSPDGRWVLVYNGEVYNHEALRHTLRQDWEFKSRCDSETVLAALALRGPAALADLVGMWALLLWDARERRLLLSRDRYGQKPLYWRKTPDGIVLASEIRPLLADGAVNAAFRPAVAEYLATGNYGHLGTRTFFRDVYSFPPAHWAWLTEADAAPQPQRYWRFPVRPEKERRPYDETARRQFREVFDEAVESQLMSDVPVGVTLSGGLDSSTVLGAIAARGHRSIAVFTAQSAGSDFDETPYARSVIEKWRGQLEVHWTPLEEQSLSDTVAEMIGTQEEPFGDPSIIAHGMLMKAARAAGVPVILGGQGGDELLFGYPFMAYSLLARNLRLGRVRWAWGQMKALGMGQNEMLRAGLSCVLPGVERWARSQAREKRRFWLSPALRAEQYRNGNAEWAAMSDSDATWLETVERVALPHLTHYDDRGGMRYSIEGRMPFLDHRLADVVASLRADAFLHAGYSKWILREACRDLLPEAVAQRRDKVGFHTSLKKMLRAESAWVRQLLGDPFARSLEWYDVDLLLSYLDNLTENKGGNETMRLIWRALAARVWAETFNIGAEG